VLHNQVGMFENLKVEWVPGHAPTAYFYSADKQEVSSIEVGDKDLTELMVVFKDKGFAPTKKVVVMGDPLKKATFGGSSYELYRPGRPFVDAKEFAESLVSNGVKGHLATITSQAENDAIRDLLKDSEIDAIWLGAQDSGAEGTWSWVSGPESNQVFWKDGKTLSYANWKEGEPNNANKEDCATFVKEGFWNDAQCEPFYSVLVEYSTASPSVTTESGGEKPDL